MIDKNNLDFNELTFIYSVSNTPYYLFTHFKQNLSIVNFANKNDVSDLINCISELIIKSDLSLDEHILLYSSIVALNFKDYFNWEVLLNIIPEGRFNFIKSIILFIIKNKIPTKNFSLKPYQTNLVNNIIQLTIPTTTLSLGQSKSIPSPQRKNGNFLNNHRR